MFPSLFAAGKGKPGRRGLRRGRQGRRRGQGSGGRRWRRLRIEALEDRRLLAIGTHFNRIEGILGIVSDAGDEMDVSYNDAAQVTVNGFPALPDGQPIPASAVRELSVLGGPGDDWITVSLRREVFSQLSNRVYVWGHGGNDWLSASDSWYQVAFTVEFHGGPGDDVIEAGSGRNWLYGEDGNDMLRTTADGNLSVPPALVDGGPGDDLFVAKSEGTEQRLRDDAWSQGYWQFGAPTQVTPLRGIERAQLATTCFPRDPNFPVFADASGFSGNVTLQGSECPDILRGGRGNDELVGGGGHDRLDGRDGSDRLVGGNGRDTYEFRDAGSGAETDTIVEGSEANELDFSNILVPNLSGPTPGARVSLISTSIAFTKDRSIVTARPDAFTDVLGSSLDD